MAAFEQMDRAELQNELNRLKEEYAQFKAKGLSLNMARGKPSAEQLDLSLPLLSCISSAQDCIAEDGTDCRNYGVLDGLPEAKRLMAEMLDDVPENVSGQQVDLPRSWLRPSLRHHRVIRHRDDSREDERKRP